MANSLGTLSGEIIIRRALALTFTKFPRLAALAKGFKELDGSVEKALLGQTVRSRKLTLSTVGNFGDAASAFTTTDVSGTLTNFRQIRHDFAPEEVNSTDRNLIEEAALPMATALARAIVRNMAALVCNSNFNATVNSQNPYLSVASGWSRANTVLPLQALLNERGVPEDGRFFFYNSDVNTALLQDITIVAEYANKMNEAAIASGKLPTVSDMAFDVFPALPNTDGNLVGFAGTSDALMYVARAPKNPLELTPGLQFPGVLAYITDENSGFQVQVTQWIDPDTMKLATRLAWFDGLSVGNTTNLVRLVNGVISGSANTLVGVTVTNPGYGYVNSSAAVTAPDITFTGGAGSSAAGTATVSTKGAVTAIGSLTAGSGYTSAPTVVITPASSGTKAGAASAVATIGGLY